MRSCRFDKSCFGVTQIILSVWSLDIPLHATSSQIHPIHGKPHSVRSILSQATLSQIHAAEAVVEEARKRSSAASERLDIARFALRERQAAQREASGLDEEGEPPVGLPVEIKVRLMHPRGFLLLLLIWSSECPEG